MLWEKKSGIDGAAMNNHYNLQLDEAIKCGQYVTAEIIWRILVLQSAETIYYQQKMELLRKEALNYLDEAGREAYHYRDLNKDNSYWLKLWQHMPDLERAIKVLEGDNVTDLSEAELSMREELSGDVHEQAVKELKKCWKASAWLLVYLAEEYETGILRHEQNFLYTEELVWWNRLTNIRKQHHSSIFPQHVPMVSIMIPTYNRPDLFSRTLRSAAIQDYPHLEIIVCDNSTNEYTAAVMEEYSYDSRICYVRNKEAKSKEENFQAFAGLANGEYLQWLMDDDILAPHKISGMAFFLYNNPSISLITSQRGVIDGDGNRIDYNGYVDLDIQGDGEVISGDWAGKSLLRYSVNFIGEPSAVLFRRNQLKHHYWRAESRGYMTISDIAMWLELLELGDLFIYKEARSYYRRHEGQEGQQIDVVLLSRIEWVNLIRSYYRKSKFITQNKDFIAALSHLVAEYNDNVIPVDRGTAKMREQYIKTMNDCQAIIRESDE